MKLFRLLGYFVILFLISACATTQPVLPTATPTIITPTITTPPGEEITGRVIDMDGTPIQGANVSSDIGNTQSDSDGWFVLPSTGEAQWVSVKQTGYISRVRAAMPGTSVLFRLTPDDGKTIVLHFGGDTMFGRRFFDPNEDGDPSDGLLPVTPDLQNHLALLAPIQPLLENADITVLNLESPISDQPFISPRDQRPLAYHSTKDYIFASHPSAVAALKQAGVDVVDLGNNHLYDILEVGLNETLSVLDQAELAHFGAGLNEAAAWTPALFPVKGQTIAFIGCTTIWRPEPPVTPNDVTYVASDASGKGGAARCEEGKLREAISSAKRQANLVTVMIHGGYEYGRLPSDNVKKLSDTARLAGADLVINHHPHVVSGFSWNSPTLTAWSLGNFIFDQTVWPTFESYLLAVYVRDGKVIRAYAEPLMVENYVARGLTGDLADYVLRGAAGRMAGPFIMESGAMEVDIDQRALQRVSSRSMDGGSLPGQILAVPQGQSLTSFKGTGSLLLGRDILWIGGFENNQIVENASEAPLWDLSTVDIQVGKDYAYEGNAGIRLTRGSRNNRDAVATHLHRMLVTGGAKLSIIGMLRASPGSTVLLQVSSYPDTRGSSSIQFTQPITVQTPDQWQPFRVDFQTPAEAVAAGVFLRLLPPSTGTVHADFDNLRVIEWASPDAVYSPLYNFAWLTGSGELTFAQQVLPGAESWFAISQVGPGK